MLWDRPEWQHRAQDRRDPHVDTGTPAVFLHPVEALHGDLGTVGRDDVATLVSTSGDASEAGALIDYLTRLGVPIVPMVGSARSQLAERALVVLYCSVEDEACPMDLAPTSSTTTALAMGDALAIAVLQIEGFQPEDSAPLHPRGSLGRKLSIRVADIMISEAYPRVDLDATMKDAIVPLAEMRGAVPIVDEDRPIVGVITAGDLTRLMEHDPGFLDKPVAGGMTRSPKTATGEELGSAAVSRMEDPGVMAFLVIGGERRLSESCASMIR